MGLTKQVEYIKLKNIYLLQLHATFRLRHSYLLGSSARGFIITGIDSSSCFLTVIITLHTKKRLKDRENVN